MALSDEAAKNQIISEYFARLESDNNNDTLLSYNVQSCDTQNAIEDSLQLNFDSKMSFKSEYDETGAAVNEHDANFMCYNSNYDDDQAAIVATELDHDYRNDPNDPMNCDKYFVVKVIEVLQKFSPEDKVQLKSEILQILFEATEQ